jgi:hypothetical protein
MSHPLQHTEWLGRKIGDCVVRMFWDQTASSIGWIDFEVFDIVGVAWSDGTKGSMGFDAVSTPETALFDSKYRSDNMVVLGDEARAVSLGFIKWDGCMQFKMDCHVDTKIHLESIFNAVVWTRRECLSRMAKL